MKIESIFKGETTIIPLADVQHIEKHFSDGRFYGYKIITKHTRWDMEADVWANNIYLDKEEGDLFLIAWEKYRYQIEYLILTK